MVELQLASRAKTGNTPHAIACAAAAFDCFPRTSGKNPCSRVRLRPRAAANRLPAVSLCVEARFSLAKGEGAGIFQEISAPSSFGKRGQSVRVVNSECRPFSIGFGGLRLFPEGTAHEQPRMTGGNCGSR